MHPLFAGSSDSRTKKDSRNKSMFTSLFKKNVKEAPVKRPQPERALIDPKLTNVEYRFKQEVRNPNDSLHLITFAVIPFS